MPHMPTRRNLTTLNLASMNLQINKIILVIAKAVIRKYFNNQVYNFDLIRIMIACLKKHLLAITDEAHVQVTTTHKNADL